jgi:hypothetical protein
MMEELKKTLVMVADFLVRASATTGLAYVLLGVIYYLFTILMWSVDWISR